VINNCNIDQWLIVVHMKLLLLKNPTDDLAYNVDHLIGS